MVSEFFGHTCVPDSRVAVRERNLLETLLVVDVKCILYLVSDRHVGNRGSLCDVPAFALLVTKTLNYPVSLGHFLQMVSDWGSKEQFLEERFRRFLLEAFTVFLLTPADVVCGLPITTAKKDFGAEGIIGKLYVEFRWWGYLGS